MRRTGRGNAFFFVPFYAKKRIFAKTGGLGQTYRNLNGKDVSAAGIMIYHDMMYPGHPEHAPANTTDQVHKRTHNHALNFAKTEGSRLTMALFGCHVSALTRSWRCGITFGSSRTTRRS
jgi:hypothetical protein